MKKHIVLLWLFFLFPLPGFGLEPGTSGADILKVPIGVRPAALGGTYAAFGDDVYVIGYNPAGLAGVSKYSLGVDHIEGFGGVGTESLSLAIPTQDYGNIGGQFIFRHMPTIQNSLATDPPINANDFVLTVADAQQFGKIAIGGAFKTVFSNLGEKQAFTQAIDLGVKVQFFETDFAFVAQNIGPAVQFQPVTPGNSQTKDPLPLTFRLGLSRPIIVSPASTLLASVEAFNVRDEGTQASIGIEYWHRSILAIRVGYRASDSGNLAGGFSAGAGLRYNLGKLEYEFGYAWRPSQVSSTFIANSHIFGLLFWY
jgi:hypothetical protein